MGRGIQAALAALGAKAGARGAASLWSLDLARLKLFSVFGGGLGGEALLEVTSEEALSFREPAELAALGSLWVPGLETGEALLAAVTEAHESLRARLDNDLETLARLGIDARLGAPVARARGTLQLGDDEVAVAIDDAGELVVTHVGAARVPEGQGRALGAPEDTEAEEALLRITRVVQRVRERGLLQAPDVDDESDAIDVDVGSLEGDPAGQTGANVWSEDEHTHAVGESSGASHTQHLSDEQLAAVQQALSEESEEGDRLDLSDEAEPIEEPPGEPEDREALEGAAAAAGAGPDDEESALGPTEPQPLVEDDDDIRTVSISLRQQSSLLKVLDAMGRQGPGPPAAAASDNEDDVLDRALDEGAAPAPEAPRTDATPPRGLGAADLLLPDEPDEPDEPVQAHGPGLPDDAARDLPPDEEDGADEEPTISGAMHAAAPQAAPPSPSPLEPAPPLDGLLDLPEGSDEAEARPTVVLPAGPAPSAEGANAMPPPTASVPPVDARVASDELEKIARGFDDGDDLVDDLVEDAPRAAAPPPEDQDDEGDDDRTAGFRFDKPTAVHTLDDAPPATHATVSQPDEPAAPGPSLEEPSEEEPEPPRVGAPPALPPVAVAVAVDSLALLPPDEDSPPTRDYRLEAPSLTAGASRSAAASGVEASAPPFDEEGAELPPDVMEPADTAALHVPSQLAGTADSGAAEGDAVGSGGGAVSAEPAEGLEPGAASEADGAPPPISVEDEDDEPKTRPFVPADLLGLLRRTTDQDNANPEVLEARAAALEAEAQELRLRAGALRARQAAVTVVPPEVASGRLPLATDAEMPPPPVVDEGLSVASSSSLPSLPSIEVHALDPAAISAGPEDEEGSATDAPGAPQRLSSAEEGVSLAEVRAALGGIGAEATRVVSAEAPPEPAPSVSGESDVFASGPADGEEPLPEAPEEDEPEDSRRAIVLVVEDARARDRLKRHLSARFDELFEADDATTAVELPNLSSMSAMVFVRPRPDARTRLGLTHLEKLRRRPRVLIISSDNAFDEMPSVDQRLPLGQRASEVAQQVIDGLTSLGVQLLPP